VRFDVHQHLAQRCSGEVLRQSFFELADLHRARMFFSGGGQQRIGVAAVERFGFVGEDLFEPRELINECFEGLPQRACHGSIL
jgi:hypothetical protein